MQRWRSAVRKLKREAYVLYLAYRDPRVPWYARLVAGVVVAYAFSPFDLIPDVIPLLGYLDDLIVVPLGILLAVRLIPPPVLVDARREAERIVAAGKPVSRLGAAIVITLWLAAGALCFVILRRLTR